MSCKNTKEKGKNTFIWELQESEQQLLSKSVLLCLLLSVPLLAFIKYVFWRLTEVFLFVHEMSL